MKRLFIPFPLAYVTMFAHAAKAECQMPTYPDTHYTWYRSCLQERETERIYEDRQEAMRLQRALEEEKARQRRDAR